VPPAVEARLHRRLPKSNREGLDNKGMQAVTNRISQRISSISVSSTMKVAADAERLRAQGVDVVDFGAGEPDFPRRSH